LNISVSKFFESILSINLWQLPKETLHLYEKIINYYSITIDVDCEDFCKDNGYERKAFLFLIQVGIPLVSIDEVVNQILRKQ